MRKTIATPQAPQAIGPYSQGVAVGHGRTVWCSGQIPLDPATGELVPGDIVAQTERALKNLQAVLAQGGLEMRHVLKCTVFLVDLSEFARMNEVYGRFFPENPPARSTVQVAALPRGARVEIDCVAAAD
ncbi:MAG TPA: RidA family protein [Anaeromyxobacteraceae bacterium]|nr:RidA family protein [Anaeromyxobacteraceae bacterium]